MSFKIPLDAFSSNPFKVIFGPATNSKVGGISIIDFVFVISYFFILFKLAKNWLPIQLNKFAIFNKIWISWLIGVTLFTLLSLLIFFAIILPFLEILNSFTGFLGKNIIGLTIKNYQVVWIDQDLCTGDGLCEEICPSIFHGHDDGLFYVKEGGAEIP